MNRFSDVHSVPKDSESNFKLDQSFKNEYGFLFSAFILSLYLQLLSFAFYFYILVLKDYLKICIATSDVYSHMYFLKCI